MIGNLPQAPVPSITHRHRMPLTTLLTALSVGVGCSDSHPPAPTDNEVRVIVQMSETVDTIATLSWDDTLCEGGTPTLKLSPAHGTILRSADAPGELTLFGLHPSETYDFDFALTAEGDTCISQAGSLETGALPGFLPDLSSTPIQPDQVENGYMLSALISQPSTVILHDLEGNIVWWYRNEDEALTTRAVLLPGTRELLFNSFTQYSSSMYEPVSGIARVSLDGAVREALPVENAHHDFCSLTDGSIAYIGKQERHVDGLSGPYYADTIDILDTDGGLTQVWNGWDEFPLDTTDPRWNDLVSSHEWTHANALVCDEHRHRFYLSLHNRSEILEIDANNGATISVFGGVDGDYELVGEGRLPSHQHHFEFTGDDLIILDNGVEQDLSSRAVEYHLNPHTGEAEQVWEYTHEPAIFVYVLGDAITLPDANKLIVWSTAGEMSVVSPEEEELWRLNTDAGTGFGYTTWLGSLGPPIDERVASDSD